MVWLLKLLNQFNFLIFSLLLSLNCFGFEKGEVKVGKKRIKVDIAKTPDDRSTGMMMRTNWGEIEGMLFVFPNERLRSFWMKNTFLPLSIGFFSKDKVLLEIYDLKATKSMTQKNYDSVKSKKPAKFVLEVPKGWFDENNVTVGQVLKLFD